MWNELVTESSQYPPQGHRAFAHSRYQNMFVEWMDLGKTGSAFIAESFSYSSLKPLGLGLSLAQRRKQDQPIFLLWRHVNWD